MERITIKTERNILQRKYKYKASDFEKNCISISTSKNKDCSEIYISLDASLITTNDIDTSKIKIDDFVISSLNLSFIKEEVLDNNGKIIRNVVRK